MLNMETKLRWVWICQSYLEYTLGLLEIKLRALSEELTSKPNDRLHIMNYNKSIVPLIKTLEKTYA